METFLPSADAADGSCCARSSSAVKSQEVIRSSLLSTCVGAHRISPASSLTSLTLIWFCCVPTPHFLHWSLVCHWYFSAYLCGISFFLFSFGHSAWHCRSKFLKVVCSKELWEEKKTKPKPNSNKEKPARSYLKGALKFANCHKPGIAFCSWSPQSGSKVKETEQKLNNFVFLPAAGGDRVLGSMATAFELCVCLVLFFFYLNWTFQIAFLLLGICFVLFF